MTTRRVDELKAGYYKLRKTKGGVWVAAELIWGPPEDPITGEALDRSWRWWVKVNGRYDPKMNLYRVTNSPRITKAKHDSMVEVHNWAVENARALPEANPHRPVKLERMASLF